MAKHSAPRSAVAWASIALGVIGFVLAGVAWSQHVSRQGRVVAGNVLLAGSDMAGLTEDQVRRLVEARAVELGSQTITIEYQGHETEVALGRLGFDYNVEETTAEIMSARHDGSVWRQLGSWVTSPVMEDRVEEMWSLDRRQALEDLATIDELTVLTPREPRITNAGRDYLYVIPGRAGTAVDASGLVDHLEGIDLLSPPAAIVAELAPLGPGMTDVEAQGLADQLNELTRGGVTVSVSGRTVRLDPRRLRRSAELSPGQDGVGPAFDQELLQKEIESAFPDPVGPFVPPTFGIAQDGSISRVEAGSPSQVCCASNAAGVVAAGILDGDRGPFRLESRDSDQPMETLWADGSQVTDLVSEFTTPHNCCEARVGNIHRIADIVRGYYLLPDSTLSLNGFVGPRTTENGFVAAGAIRRGHLVAEVGGGVSQFATTIFNAAYFAGLDFDQYRSHTIYFSRYPYGREATISNPAPDLVIRNTTPYPVLIWTSYTDTSITVSMYSTKNVEVEDIDQRVSHRGACTHVETDRQRTYDEGRQAIDTFVADYRPAEGVDCSGRPIPEP